MATEKRLIDANALVDAIEDIDWYHFNLLGKLVDRANPAHNTPLYKAFDIYNAIKNAPTVDAVEVVRCKDCKNYEQIPNKSRPMCTKFLGLTISRPEDFCSYGERRTET